MRLTKDKKSKVINLAENMSDDFDAEKARQFSEKHSDKNWIGKFRFLLQMVTDREFSLGPATWAILAGAIAYVVLPLDFIPDFIPGLGWIDDIFVLTAVSNQLSKVIEQYRAFREETDNTSLRADDG